VHPWGVDTPDQVPLYKLCWRHAALALKAGGPIIKVEWTNSKKTSNDSIHVLDMNPGDDVTDLWGVHYYDAWPLKNTQAIWDEYYNATYNNGPWGLGAWLAAAKLHLKKLGVAEWGLKQLDTQTAAQADDPVYMDNMYRFFRDKRVLTQHRMPISVGSSVADGGWRWRYGASGAAARSTSRTAS
jgi:hypothetical protein